MTTKKDNTPKVKFKDKSYQVTDVAGNSVKITDGRETIIVGKEHIKPTNKEARDLLK